MPATTSVPLTAAIHDAAPFEARLPHQFDALIHLDETHAVEPLDRTPSWDLGEPPETYPTGL